MSAEAESPLLDQLRLLFGSGSVALEALKGMVKLLGENRERRMTAAAALRRLADVIEGRERRR